MGRGKCASLYAGSRVRGGFGVFMDVSGRLVRFGRGFQRLHQCTF